MVLTGPLVYLAMLPNIIILVVGYLCTAFYNRRSQVWQACCTANSWPTSSRHLGSTPISLINRICYSTSELLSFRKMSPKQRVLLEFQQYSSPILTPWCSRWLSYKALMLISLALSVSPRHGLALLFQIQLFTCRITCCLEGIGLPMPGCLSAFLSMRKLHVPVFVPLSHLKLNWYGLKLDHCVFQDRYVWFWLELSTTHFLALLRAINASCNLFRITWSLSFVNTRKVCFLFVVISTLRVCA